VRRWRWGGIALAALVGAGWGRPASAQSWWLKFHASAQHIQLRGLTEDSLLATDAVTAATGGLETPGGVAVNCPGGTYCYYFLPGAVEDGLPASGGMDMSLWGLGVQGLSVKVSTRALTDLSGGRVWPGTSPAVELLQGYAEYIRGGWTVQGGRLLEQGRLAYAGTSGIDGLRADWRFHQARYELGGYTGWGLARGATLPVTSPAVDPLAEYQPSTRQIVIGALAGVHLASLDVVTEYRRELDPVTDYIVAERAAVSVQAELPHRLRLVSGADYDLAQARWGSAEATVAYSGRSVWATLGARHYRPFFDLWTVWGVFSPSPYNGVNGSLAVNPGHGLQLRAGGEWFKYEAAGVSVPTVPLEDRGWRWNLSGTLTPRPEWTVTASGHGSLLPGASSTGIDGRVTWRRDARWDFSAEGGSLESPLEFRYQNDGIDYAGVGVAFHTVERWQLGANIDRYWQSENRPDAASFDFNQWRISARVTLTLRSAADSWLPPASMGNTP
jgi:hypothetical protein